MTRSPPSPSGDPPPATPPSTAAHATGVSAAQLAVADMRATARWTIAATSAVGGLLLGGFPLTAIGEIHSARDITLAVCGLVLAMAGVSWAIWSVGEVLTPRFVTLRSLHEPALATLRAEIEADPHAFFGPFGRTAEELERSCRLHATIAARLAAMLAVEENDRTRATLTHKLSAARTNVGNATARRRVLLEYVHAWQVRVALRHARIRSLLASCVVVVGAVLFLLATDGG